MKDMPHQIGNRNGRGFKESLPQIIENASSTPEEADYPLICSEFKSFYTVQLAKNIFPPLLQLTIPGQTQEKKTEDETQRIVIIGDLHSDFNALSSILMKLANSSYDYYEKGLFIFTGDYTDRGCRPIETLRLLYTMKSYLGERCIMLKGNHELIRFEEGLLHPMIYPSDTYMIFNWKLGPTVSRLYADYCARLPHAVVLNYETSCETRRPKPVLLNSKTSPEACCLKPEAVFRRYLICHAAIPRYDYVHVFNEEKLAGSSLPAAKRSDEGIMIGQMVWGDPAEVVDRFMRDEIRFEFGKSEFIEFMNKNRYDFLIRSHQYVENGFRFSFDNRLITIFSTGGEQNDDSFYSQEVPNPCFAVIKKGGTIEFEKVFL
jgi:serine/threonine-protein phosphatase 5